MRTHVVMAKCNWVACLCAAVAFDSTVGTGAGLAEPAPALSKVSTARIGQLTGGSGPNPYDEKLNMIGTDLGVSFQRDDTLYFLFGDTWTPNWFANNQQDLDSVASTSARRPNGVPKLEWKRGSDDRFLPFSLEAYDFKPMEAMSVPVEGLVIDDLNYIFFYNRAGKKGEDKPPVRSVIAHTVGHDFSTLIYDSEFESEKFQSVSALRDGDSVWIYGAGPYRNSPVYLAQAPVATLTNRSTWTYYRAPGDYQSDERLANKLFDDGDQPTTDCVGELSVRKYDGLYFMAYNCARERTAPDGGVIPQYVLVRAARHPEGPWSAPVTIMSAEDGYRDFIYSGGDDVQLDEEHLVDPVFAPDGTIMSFVSRQKGDVYGPYLIPQWFSEPAPGEYEIVYTISSWNPYQVHLMKTVLRDSSAGQTP